MDKAMDRRNPQHPILREAAARGAPRRRRKSLRQHFCDGIEAAVKAEPAAFAATKPRTMMGQMVQELVRIAATGHCGQIKLVASFLEEAEARRNAQIEDLDDSQGISGRAAPPEPRWDWDEDGVWDSSERESEEAGGEEPKRERPGDRRAAAETMRADRQRPIGRVEDVSRQGAEVRSRAANGAAPPDASISGNFPPCRAEDHGAGTLHIGARRAET